MIMNQRYAHTFFLATAAATFVSNCYARCLNGDIMYLEGDSIGHIGLECTDDSTYEGSTSTCGPDGTFVEDVQTFTCPEYCVQCGPRGLGAALCLSTPTTDRDCGEAEYFDNNSIVCPDGQDPIPNTFCGRGNNRADCADDEFCFTETADRFAVCCPNPEECCDPDAYDSSWEWGNYCCSDGNWYAVDGSGGGNCLDKQLTQSVACPSTAAKGDTGGDLTEMEIKCCDPENGPGGCPDENGSFDRCWDEGGYCCSDGGWYHNESDGGGNCLDKQLIQSIACPTSVERIAVENDVNPDVIPIDQVNASGPDNNRKRRRRKPANNVSPATNVPVNNCFGLRRKKCNKDPKCGFTSDGGCMPKPTGIRPVPDDGGEDSVEDPNLLVEIDPCAKMLKRNCKKAKLCRYKRTKNSCQSRRPKTNAVAGDVDLKGTNNISTDPPGACVVGGGDCAAGSFCRLEHGTCLAEPDVYTGMCEVKSDKCVEIYDPVCGCDGRTYDNSCFADTHGVSISRLGECTDPDMNIIKDASQGELSTEPTIEGFKCGSRETCSEAGTTCTVGTETCCGVTHNSMECTCEGVDGRLQYLCMYTDRCMIPSCCQSGPPADMPSPAYGTCAIGELCDTGIADDYCCYDVLGGSGTYCSKSGGEVTINEPRSAPSTPAPEELVQEAMFKMYQGPCTIDSECEGGLVCHASSRECICNSLSNEGCNSGQTCRVHPEAYCPQPEGCAPTCTCDYNSDATDGSNGCLVGEVCRTPCAMVDGGPMCFESNEKRDCGDVWPSNYVCADSNGDGVIDRNDYAAGCVEGN